MKQTIRLTESELKGIIREMLNEVALTGKSGKKYSMHGNDPEAWLTMMKLHGKKNGNSQWNYSASKDENNYIDVDNKQHPNLKSRNNAKRIDAVNKRTDKAADDLMNESIRRVIRKMLRENVDDATSINIKESVKRVLKESDNVSFEDVPEALSKGVRPQDIFDKIYPEKEGFYMVALNNKINYVSTEGKLLSSLWFSDGGDFHNGWASVGVERREGKIWNLINTKGELFSTEWAHEPWEIISWENELWGDYSKYPKDGLDEAITHAIRKCLC